MTADLATQWSLLLGGLAAVLVFVRGHGLYFGLSGAALLFLGADEGLDIHEQIGEWAEREAGSWVVQDADSLVLAAWGAGLLGLTALRWRDLASMPAAALSWCAGALLGAGAVSMDALVPRGMHGAHGEEFLEAAGAVLLSGAYVAHAAALLSSETWRGFAAFRPHRRAACPDSAGEGETALTHR